MTFRTNNKVNLTKIKARDIMSEVVVTIPPHVLVKDAAHLMLRDRINGVLVVDESKKVIGILTLTDLFKIVDKALKGKNYDFYNELFHGREFKTYEIMTRDVLSITPTTSLNEIIRLTIERKIHTFPVMSGNKLKGIVGRHDILNAVFSFY